MTVRMHLFQVVPAGPSKLSPGVAGMISCIDATARRRRF